MREQFEKNLRAFKRRTISLDELEQLTPINLSYETFASLIIEFENENILEMVKSKGRNTHTPSIAYRYRINQHHLNRSYHKQLQTYRFTFHNAINLDSYFKLSENVWLEDLPYLEKINTYIKTFVFPQEKAPAPERSFELVGEEKWIEEKGTEVLQRVKLWDTMKIFPVSDPLMFAINPNRINEMEQFHLIVENKTTYQGLLPVLTKSLFSTLIYGAGNKIPKSIENFSSQYPVKGSHTFFYFGDIDQSGITIWHSLHQREQAIPALPFYESCFMKDEAYGKTNQHPNKIALQAFLSYFKAEHQKQIRTLLKRGAYYPQEVLQTMELQHIWLQADWNAIENE